LHIPGCKLFFALDDRAELVDDEIVSHAHGISILM
jgi:hypothetical protein